MLKAEVFSHESFKQAVAADFVLIKVNTDHSKDLSRKYNIEYLPTVVFLNPAGQEVARFVGAKSMSEVLKEAKDAKSKF